MYIHSLAVNHSVTIDFKHREELVRLSPKSGELSQKLKTIAGWCRQTPNKKSYICEVTCFDMLSVL